MKHGESKQQFVTGAQRDTQSGKLRYDLISPFALKRLATIYTKGAEHYGDRNWEKGIPFSRMIASMQRHMMAFLMGETDEDHLGQAVWNGVGILHFQEMIERGVLPAALDDMPEYGNPTPPAYESGNFEPPPTDHMMLKSEVAEADYNSLERLGCPAAIARQIIGGTTYANLPTGTRRRIAYVAGPMRGYDAFNFPAFDKARDFLVRNRWDVISPADIGRIDAIGRDPTKEDSDKQLEYALRDFWSLAFIRSMTSRPNDAEYQKAPPVEHAIALLPNWWQSTGATAEVAVAKWLGLAIIDAMTGKPLGDDNCRDGSRLDGKSEKKLWNPLCEPSSSETFTNQSPTPATSPSAKTLALNTK